MAEEEAAAAAPAAETDSPPPEAAPEAAEEAKDPMLSSADWDVGRWRRFAAMDLVYLESHSDAIHSA